MVESTAHNAFAEAAKEYLKTGLGNPIPLPVGQKHPVPSGYTSDDGKVVTDDQIDKWIAAGRFGKDKKTGRPHIIGNVGIHLTETIVGLDVDDYPKTNKDGTPKLNKAGEPIVATGAATLKTLIDAHGPLPETYISTARGEPERSGIRLYRVPAGMQAKFSGIAGPGIDVIRQRHRYMAVAPSGNPDTGTRYEWSGLDIETGSEWPSIDQIPDLPEAWLNHLLAKKRCSCGVGGVKSKAEKQHEDGQVHESETLFHSPAEAAAALGAALGDGMNRHDVATTVTLALVRYEELGRAGATEELERLRELFVDALDGERDEDPGDEWDRMVDGARNLVKESPSDDPATPTTGRRKLRLRSVENVKIEKVDWLVPHRVPIGSTTTLVGHGGLGKSTWTCDLGARTTRGETKGDLAGEPGGVVILSTEDAWENIIKPRLIAANANLSLMLWVGLEVADEEHPDPEALSMPEDIGVLEEAVEEWETRTGNKVRLIIFDPLIGVISDSVDDHRDKDSRKSLDPMSAMARRRKLGILGIMHFNKKDTTDVRKRISASHAFYGAVRSVLIWGTPPDSTDDDPLRILALEKHNYTSAQPSLSYELESITVETGNPELPFVETLKINATGLSAVKPDELLKSNKSAGSKSDRAKEIITGMWEQAGKGVPQVNAHIAGDKEGIGSKTMLRALKSLGGKSVKSGFDEGWTWVPPEDFFPPGT